MNQNPSFMSRSCHLRPITLALGVAVALLLSAPDQVDAQSANVFGAGWSAGVTHVTDVNADAPNGAQAIEPGTGFVVGLYVDRWLGTIGRLGVRTQASYQQPRFDWSDGRRKIDTGSADLSVLFRPILPSEGNVLPFLTAGVGGIWYDLGTSQTPTYAEADAYHDGRSRILPTAVVGLGVDLPFPMEWNRLPVSLRVEAADYITINSPLRSLESGDRHGAVHNLRFSIGLYSTLRRR
jgi:hypothetical protein